MVSREIAKETEQLPPLPSDHEDMRGPTPTSNWVIPRKLIAGAYPGSPYPAKHSETIRALVLSGKEKKKLNKWCVVLLVLAHPQEEEKYFCCVSVYPRRGYAVCVFNGTRREEAA